MQKTGGKEIRMIHFLRFVRGTRFVAIVFACVFGLSLNTGAFAAGMCTSGYYEYGTSCRACPSNMVGLYSCGSGTTGNFQCASGYTKISSPANSGTYVCSCGTSQYEYYPSDSSSYFVCKECSSAGNQNYINHCGVTDFYTSGYNSFECKTNFDKGRSSYYGNEFYTCTCQSSSKYLYGSGASAQCLDCPTSAPGNTGMSGCGGSSSTYFKCSAGYIRSKRDGTNGLNAPGYRCTSCRLSETGSTLVMPDGTSTSYQLSTITGITQVADTCKVTYSVSGYSSGSCDVDQEYTKSGVTKDANHASNFNTNAYTLSKQTIKKSASNKYAQNGNGNASTRCSSCPEATFSRAATTQANVPTTCIWIPTHAEDGIVNDNPYCDAGYYLYYDRCVTCPVVKTSGGIVSVSEYLNNLGNPNLWKYNGTSAGGSGGITSCYFDKTGSNSYGYYAYVNHCSYSGDQPYYCVNITNTGSSCNSALTDFCTGFMYGYLMSGYEYSSTYGNDSGCVSALTSNQYCFNDFYVIEGLRLTGVFNSCSVSY